MREKSLAPVRACLMQGSGSEQIRHIDFVSMKAGWLKFSIHSDGLAYQQSQIRLLLCCSATSQLQHSQYSARPVRNHGEPKSRPDLSGREAPRPRHREAKHEAQVLLQDVGATDRQPAVGG